MSSIFRTIVPLSLLTALFLGIGYYFAGTDGVLTGLVFALVTNFFAYWFSDKIVLGIYGAKKMTGNAKLYETVNRLCAKAGVPAMPVYYINTDVPNAFATGRDPGHAAIAVTKGLLETLKEKEIEGVLAHEIGHVKNRDTLISTVAAVLAGALTWLSYAFMFGDRENKNALGYVLLFFLAPLAATVLRLSISRGREFEADRFGAGIASPLDLASALEKISASVAARPMKGDAAMSALFIVNPFNASSLESLFSTHPPVKERVAILRKMAK